jgi:hypothetical protein
MCLRILSMSPAAQALAGALLCFDDEHEIAARRGPAG